MLLHPVTIAERSITHLEQESLTDAIVVSFGPINIGPIKLSNTMICVSLAVLLGVQVLYASQYLSMYLQLSLRTRTLELVKV